MSDRVLIVEDEDVLARSIAKFLSAKGFEVETAPDGIVAMQVLREQSFDAVATDIKMPRCDGIELLRRMRDAGCTEPTIVLSAHGTLERAVAAMKLGAQDFLRKPIDLDDLESVLRRSIATTRMRQELDYLRKRQVGPDEFPEPLGDSRAMRDIRRHLQQLASAQEAVA
ncbi:MAG: response regulator, partial [Acidobacteriota bacterium]